MHVFILCFLFYLCLLELWSVAYDQISKQNPFQSEFQCMAQPWQRKHDELLCSSLVKEWVYLSSISYVLPLSLLEGHQMTSGISPQEATPTFCNFTSKHALGLQLPWNISVSLMETQDKTQSPQMGTMSPKPGPQIATPPPTPQAKGSMRESALSIYWPHRYLGASEAIASIAFGWRIIRTLLQTSPQSNI